MPASRVTQLCLSILLVAAAASSAPADIVVQKKPPNIERKTFDPKKRPPEMPELKHGEEALCTYNFTCETKLMLRPSKRDLGNGNCRASLTITKTTMIIGVDIVIWNPTNATDKLKAHEEGHREIAERIYAAADQHARKAADIVDGRRFEGEGENCEAQANQKLNDAVQQVGAAYLKLTADPCTRLQEIFDDLTDHGRKPMPEQEAIKRALKQHADETAPTTKPATGTPKPAPKR